MAYKQIHLFDLVERQKRVEKLAEEANKFLAELRSNQGE